MARAAFLCRLAVGLTLLTGYSLAAPPIRVGGNVAHANLISQTPPVYPPEAKQARIQGAVELSILIDKEGHVGSVSVISGPPELVKAAVDAVSQWVYKPTLLNGDPVEVDTTVTINFTLSQ